MDVHEESDNKLEWHKCTELCPLFNTLEKMTDEGTHSAQVGVGVQGGSGLWSPPVRSDREYLMLVYSRPLILLFWKTNGPLWVLTKLLDFAVFTLKKNYITILFFNSIKKPRPQ